MLTVFPGCFPGRVVAVFLRSIDVRRVSQQLSWEGVGRP